LQLLLQQHHRLVTRTKNRIRAEYYFQFFNRLLIVTNGRDRARAVKSNVANFRRRFYGSTEKIESSLTIALAQQDPTIDVHYFCPCRRSFVSSTSILQGKRFFCKTLGRD
jgi:hypothetical protein